MVTLTAAPAFAQTITSPTPDAVSVTIYRDPNRAQGGEINLNALQGFALITETRTVTIPQGQSDIRFEGVAGGIIPVSAIVTGLPGGVVQKNRDAQLLSPAALVNGSYGKMLHLKRTSRATGKATEEDVSLVSGPLGGVIVKTKAGFEALGCAGLPETLRYGDVPQGLTNKPTLSVTTRSNRAATVTVQLSYLATGFDWAANYVVRVREDRKSLDLFAWLTLANSNGESFTHANTQAVAGTLNRVNSAHSLEQTQPVPRLALQCWPMDITSTHDRIGFERMAEQSYERRSEMDGIVMTAMAAPPPPPVAMMAKSAMQAKQEELGDLKLYRIPEPVTVAARAQKQVALMEKVNVPFVHIYSVRSYARNEITTPQPSQILMRMRNKEAKGLGLPMPSGTAAVFEPVQGQNMLLGQAPIRDSAVGEEVELTVGQSAQVMWTQTREPNNPARRTVTLTNANPSPATVEFMLQAYQTSDIVSPSAKLARKNDQLMWLVTVPPNGTAILRYGVQGQY